MKLGIDFWSLRSQGWNIFEFLEYAHNLGLDVLHTGVRAPNWPIFESLDDDYLQQVRDRANELEIEIEIGGCSISPTSDTFAQTGVCLTPPGPDPQANARIAVADLQQLLRIARTLGSPSVRCYLGGALDRRTELPLETHIESMIKVLQAVRDLALELGVKLAIENHFGDLQGRELKALIEEAGPEFVGVCFDSANPLRTAESPFVALEHLAPYVVTSHIRDTAVWAHPRGAAVQWVPLGEGTIGIEKLARMFQERCPEAIFNVESITGGPPIVINYLEPAFWEIYPDTPAPEFAQFLKLEREGQPFIGAMLTTEWGEEAPQEYQTALVAQERFHLEQSVRYCREVLGLGEKTR
jgi:sugar phosphate isomerase/epimerase